MKRYLLLAAGLLTATLACPQSTRTPHTLLWRITGKGITRPSYLFGTMHILCAGDANLSDSLKAAIRSADEVYFEINLSDMMGMASAIFAMQMKDGKKLSDVLNPAEYQRVKDYFEKHPSLLPPPLTFGMLYALGFGRNDQAQSVAYTLPSNVLTANYTRVASYQTGGLTDVVNFGSVQFNSQHGFLGRPKELNFVDIVEPLKQNTLDVVDLTFPRLSLFFLTNSQDATNFGKSKFKRIRGKPILARFKVLIRSNLNRFKNLT